MSASRHTRWFLIGLALLTLAVVVHDVLRSEADDNDGPRVGPPRPEPEIRRGLDKTPLLYSSDYMRSLAAELEPALVTAWPDVAAGVRTSGAVVASDGEVLIALHAVASRWYVLPGGGRPLEATLVGADPIHGVGLLRAVIEQPPAAFVPFRNPPRAMPGELLIGMRSAGGAIDIRLIVAPGTPETLAERLAREPIDPGEAVTTLDGELVAFGAGPDSQIRALTVELLTEIVSALRAEGRHPHPWIGVELQTIDASLRRYFETGSVVAVHVVPGSPADRAGVEPGMVFAEGRVADRAATSAGAVRALLFPGAQIELVRPGDAEPIRVEVEDLQFPPGHPGPGTPAVVPVADDPPGVPIRVGIRGEAALVGLEDGDVVEAVDLHPVATADQLRRRLTSQRSHLLTVRRGGRRFFVTLPTATPASRPES